MFIPPLKKKTPELFAFNGKLLVVILITLFTFSCEKRNKNKSVSIAVGRHEDPSQPTIAIEINTSGDCYYSSYTANRDTAYHFHSKIRVADAERMISFINDRFNTMNSLRNLNTPDDTHIEFYTYGNYISKRGYSYFSKQIPEDSIEQFVEIIKNGYGYKLIPFHLFQTTMQFEELPTPPLLPSPYIINPDDMSKLKVL